MENKALKIIENLNEEQIIMFVEFVLKNVPKKRNENLEKFDKLEKISDKSKIELGRFILVMLVYESNELGLKLQNELIENEDFLDTQREQKGATRSSIAIMDIVATAAMLLPLVLTKMEFKLNNKKEWNFSISYGKDTKEILKTLKSFIKPFTEIAKYIKNESINNIGFKDDEKQ